MAKLELVVFDMAGTTVYDGDAVNRCLQEALKDANFKVTRDEINTVMGIPKPIAIESMIERCGHSSRIRTELLVEQIHADFKVRMQNHYLHSPEIRETLGAHDLFVKLNAAGIKIALDTGFDGETADIILNRLGWTNCPFIGTTITAGEGLRGRPYPDMIFEAMSRLDVNNSKAVAKVGDTPSDLEEGTLAGCGWVIGITSGSHSAEELSEFQHTHLAVDLAEVGSILLG